MRLSSVRKCIFFFVLLVSLFPVSAFAEPVPDSSSDLPAEALPVGLFASVPSDDTQLRYAPFIGSGWFTGTVTGLGKVYVYVPITSKGSWGTTSSGNLCNVGSSSISGIMFSENGTQYTFTCSSFAIPRYRLASSSSYNYIDCYLTVTDSNLMVADRFPPSVTFADSQQLIVIGLMGVVILCLMRYRH